MEMNYENWKDCKGYEGKYQVSDKGRVWSVKYQKILKPRQDRNGYLLVCLYAKNGKLKNELIHRLVALAFIPNPEHKPEVNHKDENKQNNCVENLEWMTHEENCNYGTKIDRAKKSVHCVELDRTFDGTIDVERELRIFHSHISDVCKGKRQTAGGYHWRYVSDAECR